MASNEFRKTLEELLSLSGVPLNEAEEEKEPEEVEDQESDIDKKEPEEVEDRENDEVVDEWKIKIFTGSRLELEFYKDYLYAVYRGKKSKKIKIPSSLRDRVKDVSKLFNEVMSYVEKVS